MCAMLLYVGLLIKMQSNTNRPVPNDSAHERVRYENTQAQVSEFLE